MRALYVSTLALFLAFFVAIFLFRFANSGAIVEPQVLGDITSIEAPADQNIVTMIDEINAVRSGVNLEKLSYSLDLQSLVDFRVTDMVTKDYYSHKSPDGYSYANYISDYDPGSTSSCENLQLQVGDDVLSAVDAWVNSSSHYKCLTNPKLSKVAISYSPHGDAAYDASNRPKQMYVFAMVASN